MNVQDQSSELRNEADPIIKSLGSNPIGAEICMAAGGAAEIGGASRGQFNSGDEEEYWRGNYSTRPYVRKGDYFEQYWPAYRYGCESYLQHVGRKFDDPEIDLQREWENVKGKSRLTWERAKQAARDAWNRVASKSNES